MPDRVVYILHKVLDKAALATREEVVAVARDRRMRTREHISMSIPMQLMIAPPKFLYTERSSAL